MDEEDKKRIDDEAKKLPKKRLLNDVSIGIPDNLHAEVQELYDLVHKHPEEWYWYILCDAFDHAWNYNDAFPDSEAEYVWTMGSKDGTSPICIIRPTKDPDQMQVFASGPLSFGDGGLNKVRVAFEALMAKPEHRQKLLRLLEYIMREAFNARVAFDTTE